MIKRQTILLALVLFAVAGAMAADPLLDSVQKWIDEGQYSQALRQLAQVQVMDPPQLDRMPAVLYYEALIYQKTEAFTAMDYVLKELESIDPGGRWFLKAKEELTRDE